MNDQSNEKPESNLAPKSKSKRRWKSEQLPRVFTIRTGDDEYRQLKIMADKTQWSLSKLLVKATLNFGIKSVEDATAERQVFEQMIFEIRRVGVNLNQISYAYNAAQRTGDPRPPLESELAAALRQIDTILQRLRRKL